MGSSVSVGLLLVGRWNSVGIGVDVSVGVLVYIGEIVNEGVRMLEDIVLVIIAKYVGVGRVDPNAARPHIKHMQIVKRVPNKRPIMVIM